MTRTATQNHLRVARTRLREAGVPATMLRPADLLAWRIDQWPLLISHAARLARLAELTVNPVQVFREAYKPRRFQEVFPW